MLLEVRAFGPLAGLLKENPTYVELPEEGITGLELARSLGIPVEELECIMVDGKAGDLDQRFKKAGRVALIPYGTPGPYRVFLGLKREKGSKGWT